MSALVGYSSDEDDQRQKDTNYDNVNMDMSDDDDDKEEGTGSDSEKLFASKEEYLAYKSQFDSNTKSEKKAERRPEGPPSEYGGFEPEDKKIKAKREERKESFDDDYEEESRKRSSNNEQRSKESRDREGSQSHRNEPEVKRSKHDDSDRHRRDQRRRSRSPRDHRSHYSSSKRSSRDFERVSSRDSHRSHHHDHRRRDDRRDNRSRRRSRSPSPNGDHRRDNDIMDRKSKKLVSMGIISEAEGVASRQMEAQVAKVKEITGVELPKYYNPTAINPLKYAEQIKKRKMLWGPKKTNDSDESLVNKVETTSEEPSPVKQSFNKWENTNFGSSQANEKFRRLMGIKSGPTPSSSGGSVSSSSSLFAAQEQQYEKARAVTHTMRGLGLGFGGQVPQMQQGSEEEAAKMNVVKK